MGQQGCDHLTEIKSGGEAESRLPDRLHECELIWREVFLFEHVFEGIAKAVLDGQVEQVGIFLTFELLQHRRLRGLVQNLLYKGACLVVLAFGVQSQLFFETRQQVR